MKKELCAAGVAVAVLGAVAVLAWPGARPTPGVGILPEQQAGLPQQPQRSAGPRHAQPATVQPPVGAAPGASVAAARQRPSVEQQVRLSERYSLRRTSRVEHYTRQAKRLEQARESARKAGDASEVSILDKRLSRKRARIKQLQAASAQP